jgi:hypothetical protein
VLRFASFIKRNAAQWYCVARLPMNAEALLE